MLLLLLSSYFFPTASTVLLLYYLFIIYCSLLFLLMLFYLYCPLIKQHAISPLQLMLMCNNWISIFPLLNVKYEDPQQSDTLQPEVTLTCFKLTFPPCVLVLLLQKDVVRKCPSPEHAPYTFTENWHRQLTTLWKMEAIKKKKSRTKTAQCCIHLLGRTTWKSDLRFAINKISLKRSQKYSKLKQRMHEKRASALSVAALSQRSIHLSWKGC